MNKVFPLFCCIFLSSLSWAGCPKLVHELAKKLHPQAALGPIEQSACKVWPYSPDKTLVVMTFISDIPEQDEKNPTYDMELVIVDSIDGKIITHRFEEKAFSDDAIFTDSITMDTARYQLSATQRAFGVRFHQKSISSNNLYSAEVLTLYYIKDNIILPVLKGLGMRESFGEWQDYSIAGKCVGEFKDTYRMLSIEAEQQNNFKNLKISETLLTSKLKPSKKSDCEQTLVDTKKRTLTLKYNNNEYLVPKDYRGYGF